MSWKDWFFRRHQISNASSELFHPDAQVNLDRPISLPEEDVLGFDPFAIAIARAISGQSRNNGFVLALNGVWGSGKTSCANLIVANLRNIEGSKKEQERTIVIRFEPWLFTGQETLIAEFFANLDRHLQLKVGRRAARAARNISRTLAKRIGPAGSVAAAAVDASGGSGVATIIASASRPLGKLLPENWLRHGLPEQRTFLRQSLTQSTAKILVVVDDLDRLEPSETKQLLGLLKSIADLPGITYLLPVDLRAVRATIGQGHDGPSFLDKILQLTLDVPKASEDGLRKLLSEGLDRILGSSIEYDQDDWDSVAPEVFNAFIHTPRNVVQLLNAITVSWPAVKAEAYFPDLFAVEAIRVFENVAYEQLRNHKAVLLGLSTDREAPAALFSLIETSVLDGRSKRGVMRLVRSIFPDVDRTSGTSRQPGRKSRRARHVAEEVGFDAYFRWSIGGVSASMAEIGMIQEAVEKGTDPLHLILDVASRKGASGSRGSSTILDAILDNRLTDNGEGTLLRALLEATPVIIDTPPSADWGYSSKARLEYTFAELTSQIAPLSRIELLTDLVLRPESSLVASAKLIRALLAKRDEGEVVARSEVESMTNKWVRERVLSNLEELRQSDNPAVLVFAIKHSIGTSAAREIADELIATNSSAQRFALDLMSDVNSSARRDIYRELTDLPDPAVVDLPRMLHVIRTSDASDLPDADRRDLQVFLKQAESLIRKAAPGTASVSAQLDRREGNYDLVLRNSGDGTALDVSLEVLPSDPGDSPIDVSELKRFPLSSFPPESEIRCSIHPTLNTARVLSVNVTWLDNLGNRHSSSKLVST